MPDKIRWTAAAKDERRLLKHIGMTNEQIQMRLRDIQICMSRNDCSFEDARDALRNTTPGHLCLSEDETDAA